MPTAPVPAKPSSTRASPTRAASTLNSVSRSLSEVGRRPSQSGVASLPAFQSAGDDAQSQVRNLQLPNLQGHSQLRYAPNATIFAWRWSPIGNLGGGECLIWRVELGEFDIASPNPHEPEPLLPAGVDQLRERGATAPDRRARRPLPASPLPSTDGRAAGRRPAVSAARTDGCRRNPPGRATGDRAPRSRIRRSCW